MFKREGDDAGYLCIHSKTSLRQKHKLIIINNSYTSVLIIYNNTITKTNDTFRKIFLHFVSKLRYRNLTENPNQQRMVSK